MLYPEEVYAFTANNKYTLRNRGRFTHYHFKCNYRKKKTLFALFCCIFKIYIKFLALF